MTGHAIDSHAADLAGWVDTFLRGEGANSEWADALKARPHWFAGPVEIPLAATTRLCGPEACMTYREPQHEWERRVASIRKGIEVGWRPPPLICEITTISIGDGNHRSEALIRSGVTSYPVVLWGKWSS